MPKHINWQSDELVWIEANRYMERPKAFKLFCEKFNRTDIKLHSYAGLCKRNGWLTGRTGCYEKGSVPANKGKKMPYNAASAATQFKKGHQHNEIKPIGYEMVNVYGYVDRKINDGPVPQDRWRGAHILNWEETHGPIPEGHCLKCLDGDKTNTDPSNWDCISRSLLPRLAGRWATPYDDAPAELKPTILAVAKLNHAKREATKREAAE